MSKGSFANDICGREAVRRGIGCTLHVGNDGGLASSVPSFRRLDNLFVEAYDTRWWSSISCAPLLLIVGVRYSFSVVVALALGLDSRVEMLVLAPRLAALVALPGVVVEADMILRIFFGLRPLAFCF